MTQQATSVYILLRRFWMQLLLVQSLSWLSIVTLLSNNLVLAQTESSIDLVVPTGTSRPPVAPVVKSASNAPQTAPTLVKVE